MRFPKLPIWKWILEALGIKKASNKPEPKPRPKPEPPETKDSNCEPLHEKATRSIEICNPTARFNLLDDHSWRNVKAENGRLTFTITGVGDMRPESANILFLVEARDETGDRDRKINFHFFIKQNFSRFFSHWLEGSTILGKASAGDRREDFKAGNKYRFNITWKGRSVVLDITENDRPFQRHELQLDSKLGKIITVAVGKHAYANHTTGKNIRIESLRFSVW